MKRENLVVDALKAGSKVDAAQSLGDGSSGSAGAVREAVDKTLAVDPATPDAAPKIEQIQHSVDRQRARAEGAIDDASVAAPPATP